MPGVALGILHDGAVTTRGLGVTNVDDPLPVTAHTVFPIASISKTFAATMAMRLVERGALDLQHRCGATSPISASRTRRPVVTPRSSILLTHAGGWEGQISGPDRGEDTLRTFVTTLMPGNMQMAPPRAAWSYNNAGFSTLGRVIEVVAGTSINAAVRDLVFAPLGLEHAGTTAAEFIVNRFAAGHGTADGVAPTLQRPFSPATSVTAGGIGLCVTDLLAYARFHLGDGTNARGERILTAASLDTMRTPQLHKQSTDDDMGSGCTCGAWAACSPPRTAARYPGTSCCSRSSSSRSPS